LDSLLFNSGQYSGGVSDYVTVLTYIELDDGATTLLRAVAEEIMEDQKPRKVASRLEPVAAMIQIPRV
jgi:hypothetical protein